MKVADISRLMKKHFAEKLNHYTIHGDLLYAIESEFFLKGYYFESSGNGEFDLAVWYFVQPLFINSDGLYLSFGNRLSYKVKAGMFRTKELEWWDATKENLDRSFQSILKEILNTGEKKLARIKTAKDFYREYKSSIKDNIHVYHAVGVCTILMNDWRLQNKMLKRLIDFCIQEIKNDRDRIEIAIKGEATELLNADSQEKRLEILRSRKDETLRNLKLI